MAKYSTDVLSYYQGLEFDRDSSKFVSFPRQALSLPVSLEVKVRFTDFSTSHGLITLSEARSNRYSGIRLIANDSAIQIRHGDNVHYSPSNRKDYNAIPESPLKENQLYHITSVSRDVSDVSIYLDGQELQGSYSGNGSNIAYSDNPGVIGRWWEGSIGSIGSGAIFEEVRIWNKALVQQEIQDNINRTLLGDEMSLVVYYPMNEGVGDTLYDHSPNQNDGIIHGATWTNKVGFKN